MFWQQTRERRISSPADRADFDSRKRETDEERARVERTLHLLQTEASLYAQGDDMDTRKR
jgi:hypothetical protein